jgi:hypothetical protein
VLSAVSPDIVSVDGVTGTNIDSFVGVLYGVDNEVPNPAAPEACVDKATPSPQEDPPTATPGLGGFETELPPDALVFAW